METMENLKKATGEELMLRFKRASLIVLLSDIKKLEAKYEKKTGNKAPSLMELIKENYSE